CAGESVMNGERLGVCARSDDDIEHQVDIPRGLDRVLLAADRDGANGVDDLQLVAAAHQERRELLELPGRLGRLGDQRHPLLARVLRFPLVYFVAYVLVW